MATPASAFFNIAGAITPTVFTPLAMERTKELTEFVKSGIVQDDPVLNEWLASSIGSGGGSQTLHRPTWNDLDADDTTGLERIGTDAQSTLYTASFGTPFPAPQGITQHEEIAVRVDRNQHWAASVLAGYVTGAKNPDATTVIGNLVGTYWGRRFQKYALSVVAGVLADNDLAPSGTEHVQFDLTFDVSGGGFVPGVTSFTAEALYDALQTLGDADNQITNLAVHSAVRNRMRKNNLIDTVRDSDGRYLFDSFEGLRLTVDDGMPRTGNVYDSYLFGPGFLHYGSAAPEYATTTNFRDEAGNGAGSKELWNRVTWALHPMGHKFVGSVGTAGGPTNVVLAAAASWQRTAQTRKNIPFARLRTREA